MKKVIAFIVGLAAVSFAASGNLDQYPTATGLPYEWSLFYTSTTRTGITGNDSSTLFDLNIASGYEYVMIVKDSINVAADSLTYRIIPYDPAGTATDMVINLGNHAVAGTAGYALFTIPMGTKVFYPKVRFRLVKTSATTVAANKRIDIYRRRTVTFTTPR